jgi:hypothetical protein
LILIQMPPPLQQRMRELTRKIHGGLAGVAQAADPA